MDWDLGRLRVEKIIVHEIPPRPVRGGGQVPALSEIESPLTPDLRNYFKEKIVVSLAVAAYDVIFDPATTSPIPGLVSDAFGPKKKSFVRMSQEMAQHLYACQTGVNPVGLLTVVQATLENNRALVILKLEKESGVRVTQTHTGGKRTLSIEHIRELMLTDKTKVFKVGLFAQGSSTRVPIQGAVSDKQRGYQPQTEVADFFLKRFLGCVLREAPDISTKRFFQATEDFINQHVTDPEIKARYQIALLAEMNSSSGTISPRAFAEQHLSPTDRQPYTSSLADSQFTLQQFDKDTSLVQSRLKRIQMDLESGLAILGPPESFREHVEIQNLEDGRARIRIEDKVKSVRGKR